MNATASSEIRAFLETAGVDPKTEVDIRRIGSDDEMVRAIIDVVVRGEKTMTYSLPWLRAHGGQPHPEPGLHVIALDARGQPAILFRLTRVKELKFGQITAADIAEEGVPLRNPEDWRPLHIEVWNEKLADLGLAVVDDMPVTAEYFELLYPSS